MNSEPATSPLVSRRLLNWLVETLRDNPEIAIFLALALGFLIGRLRFKKFTLGNVIGVLLAGVLIGQLNITISPNVKSLFFLMYLFAVGYGVGPQLVRGLKSDGLPQVYFAVIQCVTCLLAAFCAAKLAGYSMGQAAGLLSGATTTSAVLGVAGDTMGKIGLTPEQHEAMLDALPVAYAVTYLFGTVGSAWFLASIGPKLLGVDLARECAAYEEKMGGHLDEAGRMSAYRQLTARAYKVTPGSKWAGSTVGKFEAQFNMPRMFIARLRQNSKISEPNPDTKIEFGDILGIAGPRELLLQHGAEFGPEVDDPEMLDIPIQTLDVVVTNKKIAGMTLQQLWASKAGKSARGVFLRKVIRTGQKMPVTADLKIDRGDVLQIAGSTRDTDRAASDFGYPDRATEKTDVVFMGLGIAIGALIGAIVIPIGRAPLSLSTSGGTLLAGLFCGWLRSVRPIFGRIPRPALWVFNNMGLCTFIAVVGISTGPDFVAGLKSAGLSLFLWGLFVTILPFLVGIFAGKYIFKMHPGILLGCCAGAGTATVALAAIKDEAKSQVPALGYTIPYAVGNVLLITWGVVIVLMMK